LSLTADDPRHGTINGYTNLACRCPECREAWRVYMNESNHRLGRHRPRDEYLAAAIKHGRQRYKKGCRCEVCRAASAAQKRRQRARRAVERA
jgi:hypothetical protein